MVGAPKREAGRPGDLNRTPPDGCCLAPSPPSRETAGVQWAFLGHGRGGYQKASTYGFVGENTGSYERNVVTTYTGWRLRPLWMWVCVAVAVALVVYGSSMLLAPVEVPAEQQAQTQPAPHPAGVVPNPGGIVRAPPTAPPLGFPLGVATAPKLLPTSPPQASDLTENEDHDCTLPLDGDVLSAWSRPKRRWCCEHVRRGCASDVLRSENQHLEASVLALRPRVPEYACTVGDPLDHQDGWTIKKKLWCCANERIGCNLQG